MTPKISVVTPVYNGERFIAEAIESVLAQTLADWELIVIDDGSTDATHAILESICDSRVVKIRQENSGAAAARNAALDIATGEFIGFMDADDLYLPNALEDMVGFLVDQPALDVVYCDGMMCDADKKAIMRLSDVRPGMYTGWILEHVVLSASVITVPVCTLTRHATIMRGGVRFDTHLAPSEDWDFWIQLARHAQFGYLDKLTCMYRIHETNITKTAGSERRRTDLVRGRLKVMNSDWFQDLSLNTRREFFFNLLVGLLANNPKQQQAITEASPFLSLPLAIQADLLRHIASKHLSLNKNPEFAVQCLQQSLMLQPDNQKGRLLLWLADKSPALAAFALSAWRVAHNAQARVRTLGRRKPKPVPAALLSATE